MERITQDDFAWLDPWGIGKQGVLLKATDDLIERLRLTDREWIYLNEKIAELRERQADDTDPMPKEER